MCPRRRDKDSSTLEAPHHPTAPHALPPYYSKPHSGCRGTYKEVEAVPVEVAVAAQAAGIKYIGMRNEQAVSLSASIPRVTS